MDDVRTRAPGRVNLIGEHTDYNDGFVLPCAIANETRVAGAKRRDRTIAVHSGGKDAAFDVDRLPERRSGTWADYVRGIAIELRDAAVPLCGADLHVESTVPLGAGLSSSASLEIAVAMAVLALSGTAMSKRDLSLLAQRAEIRHAGTRCGIMDQFTVLHAREGFALLLDTRSLEFEHIPVPPQASVVICNTMVKHELASGAYNERREECERSLRALQDRYPAIRALRDVTMPQLEDAASLLAPGLLARARHVVSENARVCEAAQALREGDVERMGRLMYESHESLRADYAVSCAELDAMVGIAKEFDGTIGARMTGGGFGGCTVNLVRAQRAAEFRRHMRVRYAQETGIAAELYDGTPSAGASVLHE